MANFWGISTMTGRNKANAIKTKNTPVARNKPKYIRAFPEGMLLVADWKFPGISLTPLDTLNKQQLGNVKRALISCGFTNCTEKLFLPLLKLTISRTT